MVMREGVAAIRTWRKESPCPETSASLQCGRRRVQERLERTAYAHHRDLLCIDQMPANRMPQLPEGENPGNPSPYPEARCGRIPGLEARGCKGAWRTSRRLATALLVDRRHTFQKRRRIDSASLPEISSVRMGRRASPGLQE